MEEILKKIEEELHVTLDKFRCHSTERDLILSEILKNLTESYKNLED